MFCHRQTDGAESFRITCQHQNIIVLLIAVRGLWKKCSWLHLSFWYRNHMLRSKILTRVPDEHLLLSAYGTRCGNVRHGFVRTRTRTGMRIATGVRYVNFRFHQNKTVPSYLKTQARGTQKGAMPVQFRVTHEGQIRTCRHCDHPGYLAGDCPKRPPTRGQANASSINSCPLHISRSDAPIVPRCCRLGQCEWSPDTESAVGASSGGHREVIGQY